MIEHSLSDPRPVPTSPRFYPGVNWEGLKTLYLREVRRFWKVSLQTIAAPVVTTLLYMLVFVVALQGTSADHGQAFAKFVAPGLIMMAIINNAFANTSSSLIQAKLMGTAPDFLLPPLSASELLVGFGAGAATRGMVVGAVTAACVWPFAQFSISHLWAVVLFGGLAALLMGFIGIIAGLWSEKFDHLAAVTNFIIMPMTFLSGTFYKIGRLPEPLATISHGNPVFYLIDGFRYGFIGTHDGNLWIGVGMTSLLTLALGLITWNLLDKGWRLKS